MTPTRTKVAPKVARVAGEVRGRKVRLDHVGKVADGPLAQIGKYGRQVLSKVVSLLRIGLHVVHGDVQQVELPLDPRLHPFLSLLPLLELASLVLRRDMEGVEKHRRENFDNVPAHQVASGDQMGRVGMAAIAEVFPVAVGHPVAQ